MIRAKHEPASEKVNSIGNVRSPNQARSFPSLLDEAEVMGRPIIDCSALHVDSDELPVPCCVWAHSVAPAESPQQETSVSAKSNMRTGPWSHQGPLLRPNRRFCQQQSAPASVSHLSGRRGRPLADVDNEQSVGREATAALEPSRP